MSTRAHVQVLKSNELEAEGFRQNAAGLFFKTRVDDLSVSDGGVSCGIFECGRRPGSEID